MNPITSITQGCDFTLRIRAKRVATRGYVNVSFVEIADIHVNLVNLPATKTPIAYTIDSEGRLLLDIDGETLDCNSYGIEILGYYNNGNWRHQLAPAFNIVRTSSQDNYALNESDERTIDLIIVIGETYLTTKGFNQAMEEHDQDIHAHNDLRDTISNMATQISSLVTEVANAEDGIGQMQQDVEEAGYQNEQQVQQKVDAAKITSADISVDGGSGTPSGSAGVSGNKLVIALHNIKGEKGDTGEPGATGPQGPQGDSFQPIEDVSGLVLAHTIGQDNTKAMSQKGVTDAIYDNLDEVEEIIGNYKRSLLINPDQDKITSTNNTHVIYWIPVKAGEYVHVYGTNDEVKNFRYGFSAETPAANVALQNVVRLQASIIDETAIAPCNGYFVFHTIYGSFNDRKVTKKKAASSVVLNERAAKNTLLEMASAASIWTEPVQETQILSNSLNRLGLTTKSGNYQVWQYAVSEEKVYDVMGRVPASYVGYMFIDAHGEILEYGEYNTGETAANFGKRLVSPRGAVTLYVSGYPATNVASLMMMAAPNKTIYPKMAYEMISSDNTGRKGIFGVSNKGHKAVSTIRFIKVNGNFTVTLPIAIVLRLIEYDDSFQYITHAEYNISADTETPISVRKNTAYIKVTLATDFASNLDNANDISLVRMKLKGDFPNDWDTYNISQFGTDSQLVTAFVNATNPVSCDDTSDDVQDATDYFIEAGLTTSSFLWDYGRIWLPNTYDNTGEPTRLIIYCHGAGVAYDYTAYDDSDDEYIKTYLEPDYWLAEGYAIMDMEGNPFDNDNDHSHFYAPQALECYISGYKWAIEHYNIKRDGVLLGGRSMGGGMTFNMLRHECPIPIIAGCASVPSATPSFIWNWCKSERRTFLAKVLGFDKQLPSSWSSTSPMPKAEWDCLKANWDKLVKYSSMWPLITDLPPMETLMDEELNLSKNYTSPDKEDAVYGPLHMKVKAPVKIFGVKDDEICHWQRTSLLWYKMLVNGGNIVELRLYEEGGHYADTQNDNMRTTVTTRFGEVLTDIPVVYVEMLRFWRRYEQE